MKTQSRLAILGLSASILLLQGCASAVVSDSDRDTTGRYDGNWQATVLKGARVQYVENWQLSCDAREFDINIVVKDGVVNVLSPDGDQALKTNVNADGRFSLELPLESQARSSARSATTLANGTRKLFLRGNLASDSPRGRFKIGIKQFAWQGCTSKVVYEKLSDKPSGIDI